MLQILQTGHRVQQEIMCAPYIACSCSLMSPVVEDSSKLPNSGKFFNRASFKPQRVMKDESRPRWKVNFIPYIVETALPAM